jgi:hypothetical protein
MLISTLIPTALHALMALTSPLAVLAMRWQGAPEIATCLAAILEDYAPATSRATMRPSTMPPPT